MFRLRVPSEAYAVAATRFGVPWAFVTPESLAAQQVRAGKAKPQAKALAKAKLKGLANSVNARKVGAGFVVWLA